MAFTKQHKTKLLAQYEVWAKQSQAIFVIEYSKMGMKDIDAFRAKVREAGGEAHIVKNTVMDIAFKNLGYNVRNLKGTCLFGFVGTDTPALAKVFADATKNSEVFKLKGGYLNGVAITPEQVKALAELPPLPIMRGRLLGVLQAPAGKLVRLLAEPSRQLAYVVKAYSEKDTASVAA